VPLALVTGASTGIGRATALRLVAGGWTVLAGVRDPSAGERLAADATVRERLIPLDLDVTDTTQVQAAGERVREQAGSAGVSARGGLDALVNNAGVGVGGPLELVSGEDLRRQFEVNVFAQVAVTQTMLPALREAGGRVVFVSSVGGRVSTPFVAPYAASKHAVEAIADALRVELRSSNVQVALVEPGAVATPIWDKARSDADSVSIPPEFQRQYGDVPAAVAKLIEQTARRAVAPEVVAATIERALTARRMRARYLVGTDARIQLALSRVLPDHAFDWVLRRLMGL
jgi:NAD(P)-dependent dehydrogenase (short-subunit alcohol dehydrogenase family)